MKHLEISCADRDEGPTFLADHGSYWLWLALSIIFPLLSLPLSYALPAKYALFSVERNLTNFATIGQVVECSLAKISPASEILHLNMFFDQVPEKSMSLSGDVKITGYRHGDVVYSLDSPLLINGLPVENGHSHKLSIFYHDVLDYNELQVSLSLRSADSDAKVAVFEWTVVDPRYSMSIAIIRCVLFLSLLPYVLLWLTEVFSSTDESVSFERKATIVLSLAVIFYDDPVFSMNFFFPSKLWYIFHGLWRTCLFAYVVFYCLVLLKSFEGRQDRVPRFPAFLGILVFVILVYVDVVLFRGDQPQLFFNKDLERFGSLTVTHILIFDFFVAIFVFSLPSAFKRVRPSSERRLIAYTITLLVYLLICALYITVDKLTSLLTTTISREIVTTSIFTGFCIAMQCIHIELPHSEDYGPLTSGEIDLGVDAPSE